jgi:hypothetical protein
MTSGTLKEHILAGCYVCRSEPSLDWLDCGLRPRHRIQSGKHYRQQGQHRQPMTINYTAFHSPFQKSEAAVCRFTMSTA